MQKFDQTSFDIEVFYDGDCPLCRREINLLRWLDGKKKILFKDIAVPTFAESEIDRSREQLMAEIHGRLPDGTWITGVEVFRRLYTAVGWSWLVWPTRLPLVRGTLDWLYQIFARNRLRITGRCDQRCEAEKTA